MGRPGDFFVLCTTASLFTVPSPDRSPVLNSHAIVLASSLLAVVLALALVREVRWRKALQKLIHRIFTLWRNRHEEAEDDVSGRGSDRRHGGRRLRR